MDCHLQADNIEYRDSWGIGLVSILPIGMVPSSKKADFFKGNPMLNLLASPLLVTTPNLARNNMGE
jgi:hypothetical protein